MTKNKFYILEGLLLFGVLIGTFWGFWYFENSLLIRMIALGLVVIGLILSFKKGSFGLSSLFNNRFEMLSLLIIYMGVFTFYNFIYNINFPIYIIMIMILILVGVTAFTTLSMDRIGESFQAPVFYSLIFLIGLAELEAFLGLYFWPINIEVKSLVLVIVFYQILSLVYLQARSMLRLNKIIGFIIVNFLILATVLWSLWSKLPR